MKQIIQKLNTSATKSRYYFFLLETPEMYRFFKKIFQIKGFFKRLNSQNSESENLPTLFFGSFKELLQNLKPSKKSNLSAKEPT